MDNKQEIEGNKLIDIFYYGEDKGRHYDGLNYYHKDWNQLMPVVEKIENGLEWKYDVQIGNNLYAVNGNLYNCIICDAGNATYLELESKIKIEAVWLAVVEFIKWLNKTQQQ